jgi:hypothetical protein
LRVKVIALGSAVLTITVFGAWWLHSVTMLPLAPPPPEQKTTMMPPHLRRLNYHIDIVNGVFGVVNNERFAWNDVDVEIGDGDETFQCPGLSAVGRGQTFIIDSRACRSSDGSVPMHVCVVRVTARQGGITYGLEPCAPVH